MTRPRLLDLFCGAGGAAAGYAAAGFDVVGVDLAPQPRFPYEFVQSDALDYLIAHGAEFDVIHASPPCQLYSKITGQHGAAQRASHPDLVEPTRQLLIAAGRPYVIENVEGAPLVEPMMLCGTMFGLGTTIAGEWRPLRRHRLWESSVWLWPPQACAHIRGQRSVYVYGHAGGSSSRDGWTAGSTDDWRAAMGIDWMTGDELAEAIPPAYTEWIGRQLIEATKGTGE